MAKFLEFAVNLAPGHIWAVRFCKEKESVIAVTNVPPLEDSGRE